MAAKPIADEHHVVRHCKARLVRRENGQAVGVFPALFELRSATAERPQETYLSALFYEFFTPGATSRLFQCTRAMNIQPKSKDAFACISAGLARSEAKKFRHNLRVSHEPGKGKMAYATIRGVPVIPDPNLVAALAQIATLEAIEFSRIGATTQFKCG